jgi:hypothetical protein
MIIDDLNVFGRSTDPTETYPKLIVNANAVLTGTVSFSASRNDFLVDFEDHAAFARRESFPTFDVLPD